MEQNIIANQYAALPVLDPLCIPAWAMLADRNTNATTYWLDMCEVRFELTNGEPYATEDRLYEDVGRGHLYVSTRNLTHPVWSPCANIAFRIMHDLSHFMHKAPFTFEGDIRAYDLHYQLLERSVGGDANMRRALFTETVGQAAYVHEYGKFGPQKVGFLL